MAKAVRAAGRPAVRQVGRPAGAGESTGEQAAVHPRTHLGVSDDGRGPAANRHRPLLLRPLPHQLLCDHVQHAALEHAALGVALHTGVQGAAGEAVREGKRWTNVPSTQGRGKGGGRGRQAGTLMPKPGGRGKQRTNSQPRKAAAKNPRPATPRQAHLDALHHAHRQPLARAALAGARALQPGVLQRLQPRSGRGRGGARCEVQQSTRLPTFIMHMVVRVHGQSQPCARPAPPPATPWAACCGPCSAGSG